MGVKLILSLGILFDCKDAPRHRRDRRLDRDRAYVPARYARGLSQVYVIFFHTVVYYSELYAAIRGG